MRFERIEIEHTSNSSVDAGALGICGDAFGCQVMSSILFVRGRQRVGLPLPLVNLYTPSKEAKLVVKAAFGG